MIYAAFSCFGLRLEGRHVPSFWLLLYIFRNKKSNDVILPTLSIPKGLIITTRCLLNVLRARSHQCMLLSVVCIHRHTSISPLSLSPSLSLSLSVVTGSLEEPSPLALAVSLSPESAAAMGRMSSCCLEQTSASAAGKSTGASKTWQW